MNSCSKLGWHFALLKIWSRSPNKKLPLDLSPLPWRLIGLSWIVKPQWSLDLSFRCWSGTLARFKLSSMSECNFLSLVLTVSALIKLYSSSSILFWLVGSIACSSKLKSFFSSSSYAASVMPSALQNACATSLWKLTVSVWLITL